MRIWAVVLLMFSVIGNVYAAEQYESGKHYEVLTRPVKTGDPNKIEVLVFFTYKCGQCISFAHLLKTWKKTLAKDVAFMEVPIHWATVDPNVRGYFTSVELGVKDKTHLPLFDLVSIERKSFTTAEDWANFFAGYGVDKSKAIQVYDSQEITVKAKSAEQLVNQYYVRNVPSMSVNGKYKVIPVGQNPQQEMLKVVDFLIAKERALSY